MKRIASLLLALGLIGTEGSPHEIEGKWSLGVRTYGLKYLSPNISVTRGISERVALVGFIYLHTFDLAEKIDKKAKYSVDLEFLSEKGMYANGESPERYTSAGAGSEWRRYLRPSETISPYFGIGPSFSYTKYEYSSYDGTSWSGGVSIKLGTEYFVNDKLSLSIHLPFSGYTFGKSLTKYTNGDESRYTSHSIGFTLDPSLVVRLYF